MEIKDILAVYGLRARPVYDEQLRKKIQADYLNSLQQTNHHQEPHEELDALAYCVKEVGGFLAESDLVDDPVELGADGAGSSVTYALVHSGRNHPEDQLGGNSQIQLESKPEESESDKPKDTLSSTKYVPIESGNNRKDESKNDNNGNSMESVPIQSGSNKYKDASVQVTASENMKDASTQTEYSYISTLKDATNNMENPLIQSRSNNDGNNLESETKSDNLQNAQLDNNTSENTSIQPGSNSAGNNLEDAPVQLEIVKTVDYENMLSRSGNIPTPSTSIVAEDDSVAMDSYNAQEPLVLSRQEIIGSNEKPWKRRSGVKKQSADFYQWKYGKPLSDLIAQDAADAKAGNRASYLDVAAPPDKSPSFLLCAACGFISKYKCSTCGAGFCSVRCERLHFNDCVLYSLQ